MQQVGGVRLLHVLRAKRLGEKINMKMLQLFRLLILLTFLSPIISNTRLYIMCVQYFDCRHDVLFFMRLRNTVHRKTALEILN